MPVSLFRFGDFKSLKYWFATLVLIVLLSIFGRDIQLLLIKKIDSRYFAAAVFLLLFGLIALLWKRRGEYRIQKRTFLATTLLLFIGVAAVYLRYLMPVEAVHFLIFSWLGWISITVYGPFYGVVAMASVAVGDEILQYYLPSRVGDIHDVVINLISGCIGYILKLRC